MNIESKDLDIVTYYDEDYCKVTVRHKPSLLEVSCDRCLNRSLNIYECLSWLSIMMPKNKLKRPVKYANRKSISKHKFSRIYQQNIESVEGELLCGEGYVSMWIEACGFIYYFDPKRKMYFREEVVQ